MSSIVRRLDRLEAQYQPADASSVRIPEWMRPWVDPLTIEELEVLEAGAAHLDGGGDLITLPPETRAEYERLCRSLDAFRESLP